MYALNAAQQPDGEANVDLMLGEYRKLDPGPVEEFVFFDHPSWPDAHNSGHALEGRTPGISIPGRGGKANL